MTSAASEFQPASLLETEIAGYSDEIVPKSCALTGPIAFQAAAAMMPQRNMLRDPSLPARHALGNWSKQGLAFLLSGSLILAAAQGGYAGEMGQSAAQPATQVASWSPEGTAQAAPSSPEQLDQLVAPIALYPDTLLAQILAASTYPSEIVEAHRWLQQHSGLQGQALGQAVDQQSWDTSVKSLVQFPSVLANMDTNLSWTSALGEAYVNQPQDVFNAVQAMRRRAQESGHLSSTPQESVTTQEGSVVIQPADPEVVYVPEYDPWLVYGAPVAIYPGWAPLPGLYVTGPDVWFGLGFGIGIFGGFAWGWHHWGADWHRHDVVFNHNTFVSRSPTFINPTSVYRGLGSANIYRGSGATGREPVDIYRGHTEVARPAPNYYGAPHGSAFSGFDHGGIMGAYSYRGMSSYGGGFDSHPGGFYFARPGGGGFHGGGGRR